MLLGLPSILKGFSERDSAARNCVRRDCMRICPRNRLNGAASLPRSLRVSANNDAVRAIALPGGLWSPLAAPARAALRPGPHRHRKPAPANSATAAKARTGVIQSERGRAAALGL